MKNQSVVTWIKPAELCHAIFYQIINQRVRYCFMRTDRQEGAEPGGADSCYAVDGGGCACLAVYRQSG